MENREYFFHKRKAMAETEAEDPTSAGEEKPSYHHRQDRVHQHNRGQRRAPQKWNGVPEGAGYDRKQGVGAQSQS